MNYLESQLEGKTVLLLTPTGSRLYGTHRPDSDHDFWAVVLEGVKPSHKVVGEEDVAVIPLKHFQEMLNKGVPQALEALWSPQAQFHAQWESYMKALQPNVWSAKYRHLAKQGEKVVQKERMHKARLSLQWLQMAAFGKFNPTLEGELLELVKFAANNPWVSDGLHTLAEATMMGENRFEQ